MALPPLDYLLSPVPAYDLATPLGEVTEALGQPDAATPSHIVVTDDAHRPLGAIALGRLWASHYDWGLDAAQRKQPRLLDCQLWLEPVVTVVASQLVETSALAELAELALATPAPTLVVIDDAGQYLGVLSPTRLLGWLASDALGTEEIATPGARTGDQRAWVLELSHALKTPITTLLGLSTLLLDSRVGSLSDRQFRYLSLMRQAIRKLTGLVNLLLDWMRLESDQISLNLERVNLQPLADNLLTGFFTAQPEAKANADWADQFTLCLATPTSWVMADPLRLRQSLHYSMGYLLAHGASPGGLLVEPWGNWLSLTLWSTTEIASTLAAGPPPAGEPQSLEGLGLTLARCFSQLHGGELSCLSTITWGSRITLLLPAPPGLAAEEKTVLVLLACASDAVVDRVYSCLRGSPYRLAIAPSCQTLTAMQQRLAPACSLVHWASLADAPDDPAARLALGQSQGQVVGLSAASELAVETIPVAKQLTLETLPQNLRPTLDQLCQETQPSIPLGLPPQGLTMLLLRPPEAEPTTAGLPMLVQAWLQRYRCRLLQVDDLAQANLLSRVWQPQAIILDGAAPVSGAYLRALATYADLARLPLITLATPADGAVAIALGLSLIACPEIVTQPAPQAAAQLLEAIALSSPG